jgi:hypothetical protein
MKIILFWVVAPCNLVDTVTDVLVGPTSSIVILEEYAEGERELQIYEMVPRIT